MRTAASAPQPAPDGPPEPHPDAPQLGPVATGGTREGLISHDLEDAPGALLERDPLAGAERLLPQAGVVLPRRLVEQGPEMPLGVRNRTLHGLVVLEHRRAPRHAQERREAPQDRLRISDQVLVPQLEVPGRSQDPPDAAHPFDLFPP